MATTKKKFFRLTPMRLSLLIGILAIITHFCIEAAVFAGGPLSQLGFIHEMELKFLDMKFQQRASSITLDELPPPKVVIVAEDENSIEKYGLLPWSRSVMGKLVDSISAAGAKAVAFDIVFSEPDRNSAYQTIRNFEEEYRKIGLENPDTSIDNLAQGLSAADKEVNDLLKAYGDLHKQSLKYAKELKKNKADDDGAEQFEALSKALQKSLSKMKATKQKISTLKDRGGLLKEKMAAYEAELANEVANVSPDMAFANSIKKANNIILGYFYFRESSEMTGLSEEEQKLDVARIKSAFVEHLYELNIMNMGGQEVVATKELTNPEAIKDLNLSAACEAIGVQAPLDLFSDATPYKGHFNHSPDFDGPLRRTALLTRLDGKFLPSLSLTAAALYENSSIYPLVDDYDNKVLSAIYLGNVDKVVPIDATGRTMVNYYTDPLNYFPTVSARDVMEGNIDPNIIKDKIVFVGATAIGTMDQRVTPFSSFTPGVYLNAMISQNIIDGRYLLRPLGWPIFEYIFMILFAILLGFLLKKVPVYSGFVVAIGFIALLFAADLFFIFDNGYWAHLIMPMLQCLLTYVAITIYRFLTEEREKKQIRNAFQFYLSRSVVDEVLKDTSKLRLNGERKELTVLFSDIRGFTTISEGLSPEGLANLLNEYLTPMTDLVFKYDGTLDKYMGDAIMAFFGAPVSYEDHAVRGCKVALEMMAKLHELQKGWKERGLPIINIGIGLNTGDMAVGNMGSNIRFDYTVMGDNVNLGSRLEGINKQYKTNIVISEFTYRAAGSAIYARELDAVRVKGKLEPVTIYELRGLGAPPAEEAHFITTFSAGIALYKAQKWDEAITLFKGLLAEKEGDYPCQLYIDRCTHMKENPPAENWDGVFVMTTK